jgi:hypothetical protein
MVLTRDERLTKLYRSTYISWRLGYGLDNRASIHDRGSDGIFSRRHRVQTGAGDHPASYSRDTQGIKRSGLEADRSPLSSAEVNLYLDSPNTSSYCGA